MKTLDVIKFMGERGLKYHTSTLDQVFFYVSNMIRDGRISVIYDDNTPYSVIFYSMTDSEYEKFFNKDTWDYIPHNPNGNIVYVEKIVSYNWSRELRLIFEKMIASKNPLMEYGVWHRWGKHGDRIVISKRRYWKCIK